MRPGRRALDVAPTQAPTLKLVAKITPPDRAAPRYARYSRSRYPEGTAINKNGVHSGLIVGKSNWILLRFGERGGNGQSNIGIVRHRYFVAADAFLTCFRHGTRRHKLHRTHQRRECNQIPPTSKLSHQLSSPPLLVSAADASCS